MSADERAQQIAAQFCQRCAWGHFVWPPDSEVGEWAHGCDETPEGWGVPPEPCGAAALWAYLAAQEA